MISKSKCPPKIQKRHQTRWRLDQLLEILEPNGTINLINELRVRVNGNTLNNSTSVNDQPNKNIEDYLETVFIEPISNEANKIPQIKQRLQEGKIMADEYNDKLGNLKDRLKEIVNSMNIMRDNIKAQDKKIENESFNTSTAIKYVEDNIDEIEQHAKEHLKETLKIKSKVHANELDIREFREKLKNIRSNWMLVMENKVEYGNYIQMMKNTQSLNKTRCIIGQNIMIISRM